MAQVLDGGLAGPAFGFEAALPQKPFGVDVIHDGNEPWQDESGLMNAIISQLGNLPIVERFQLLPGSGIPANQHVRGRLGGDHDEGYRHVPWRPLHALNMESTPVLSSGYLSIAEIEVATQQAISPVDTPSQSSLPTQHTPLPSFDLSKTNQSPDISPQLDSHSPDVSSSPSFRMSYHTTALQHDATAFILSGATPGMLQCLPSSQISQIAILALQSSPSAISLLTSGTICTPQVRPKALCSLLQPLCQAGKLRVSLEAFMAHHRHNPESSSPDAVLDTIMHAFMQALDIVLRLHSVLLQNLHHTISDRRKTESSIPPEDPDHMIDAISDQAMHVLGSAPTPLEVSLHTQGLRVQVGTLAQICQCTEASQYEVIDPGECVASTHACHEMLDQCSIRTQTWQLRGFASGVHLLDHLHQEVERADDAHVAICRFLFSAALSPYIADMMVWTHSPTMPTASFLYIPHPSDIESGAAAQILPWSHQQTGQAHDVNEHDTVQDWHHVPAAFPAFLADIQYTVSACGQHLRLLYNLQEYTGDVVPTLARSALRQMAHMRSAAIASDGDHGNAMDMFGGGHVSSWAGLARTKGSADQWGCTLVWRLHSLHLVGAVTSQAAAERKLLIASMLHRLAEVRAAAVTTAAAEVVTQRQGRQEAAAIMEQQELEQLQPSHALRVEKLRQQTEELASRSAQMKASQVRKTREEQESLHAIVQREHAVLRSQMAAELVHLEAAENDLSRREAHMAWRLARWALAPERRAFYETEREETVAAYAAARGDVVPPPLILTPPAPSSSASTRNSPTYYASAFERSLSHKRTSTLSARSSRLGSTTESTRAGHSAASWSSRGVRARTKPSRATNFGALCPVVEEASGSEMSWGAYEGTVPMTTKPMTRHPLPHHPRPSSGVTTPSDCEARGATSQSMKVISSDGGAQMLGSSLSVSMGEVGLDPVGSLGHVTARSSVSGCFSESGTSMRRSLPLPDPSVASRCLHTARRSLDSRRSSNRGSVAWAPSIVAGAMSEVGDDDAESEDAPLESPNAIRQAGWAQGLQSQWGGAAGSYLQGERRASPHLWGDVQSSIWSQDRTSLHKAWSTAPQNTTNETPAPPPSQHVYVPVTAAVQACVHDPIEEQYQLVSSACLSLFLDELNFQKFCSSLRSVFLGAQGDFLQCITKSMVFMIESTATVSESRLALCLRNAVEQTSLEERTDAVSACRFVIKRNRLLVSSKTPGDVPTSPNVASLTAASLAEFATPQLSHRSIDDENMDDSDTLGVDPRQIGALNAAVLTYDVAWPMSIVVSSTAISSYGDVFSLLVRCCWVSNRLQSVLFKVSKAFRHDTIRGAFKVFPGNSGTRTADKSRLLCLRKLVESRMRLLIVTLQAALHIVNSVQHFMHYDVLAHEWQAFKSASRTARDLLNLRDMHDEYAARCADRCMLALDAHLSSLMAALWQSSMDTAVQVDTLIGDLASAPVSRTPSADTSRESSAQIGGGSMLWIADESLWRAVASTCGDLDLRMRYMYNRFKYRAGRGMMTGLYSQLTHNRYYDA